MIKLLKLEFKNIGRFTTPQCIDFANKPKLIQLDGYNKNTGGSSGAGKSTVFNALDLLLGLNDLPASSLQSRLTKEGFWVSGTFLFNNSQVIITRSKKEGLVIETETEKIEGSSKIGEEKIDSLIGMPRQLFKSMIHKQQKEGGFFLNLSSKESYKFLLDCLQLGKWEEKVDKINDRIKELEQSSKDLDSNISHFSGKMVQLEDSLRNILPPEDINEGELLQEKENILSNIRILSDKINKTKQISDTELTLLAKDFAVNKPKQTLPTENDTIIKLKEELSSLNKAEQDVLPLFSQQIKEAKNKESTLRNIIISIENSITNTLPMLNSQIEELEQSHAHLLESKCPTCSQLWSGEALGLKIHETLKHITLLKEQTAHIIDKRNNLPRLLEIKEKAIAEISNAEHELAEAKNIYSTKKAEINTEIQNINYANRLAQQEFENNNNKYELEYNQKQWEIQQKYLKIAEKDMDLRKKDIEKVKFIDNNIDLYRKSLENYTNLTNNTHNLIENMKKDMEKDQKQLQKQLKEINIANEAKRAIKSYTLQIFQDTLNFIGTYATKLLNAVPAMANATLYFENCKETKTGKIKDEINCILNIDGENDINIKTLSGGERTSVDIAVDFAVVEMLESHLGIGADWMVLDEPFEGMDVTGIEAIIEVIKQAGINKRIILVDHHSETKEIVDETISIVRDGVESCVVGGI